MSNYHNGIIYKIGAINGEYNHIYIGSTTKNTLRERFLVHKKNYDNFKETSNCYMKSFELFDKYGIDNCYIDIIHQYGCESNNQLQARKRFFLKNLPCINSIK